MHGRLKVRTTAEQQEAKRKEREKKLLMYNAATSKTFEKRRNKEFDKEALELTGQLLSANPDFNTLWNYRREVLLHFKSSLEQDEFQKIMQGELQFSEFCLRTNPKSYGSWHQRCFVLVTMPSPDWKTELKLCNRYLELDERNFHCWDYRRFIVSKSKVPAEDEFRYTTEKISTNFSNFSSWHYRSKLMPQIYPSSENPLGIQEDILLEEYEMVQNAFFTDPSDQSAWFYHRWLLGRGKIDLGIQLLYLSKEKKAILLVLSSPVGVGKDVKITLRINEVIEHLSWHSLTGNEYAKIWVCHSNALASDQGIIVEVQLDDGPSESCILDKGKNEAWWKQNKSPQTLFSSELSAVTSSTLTTELESVEQLHELEPDNKWVLLTIISLMRALDPLMYEKDTFKYLDKLMEIDTSRSNYYYDLKNRYLVENCIMKLPEGSRQLDLSGIGLSAVPHTDKMVLIESLDLSDNKLREIPDLTSLQCLKNLKLDDNELQSTDGLLKLPNPITVSVKNNPLKDTSSLSEMENHLKTLAVQ